MHKQKSLSKAKNVCIIFCIYLPAQLKRFIF